MAPKPVVKVEGLRDFRRDLDKLEPEIKKELRADLKTIAQRVAREVDRNVGARSFSYRGAATTGLRASVQSTGPKGFVGRFLEFGFHPRGGSTFVTGRHQVGTVMERREDQIVDEVGDAIERAARKAGWS